jgi:8-oxo-dGTP diphosphatase
MDDVSRPLIRVVAALIEKDGRYLIAQRTARAIFPLYWEFPGGKVEQGETDEEALRREMMEELGVVVSVGALFEREVHCYDTFSVDFRVYRCEIVGGEPKAIGCADFRFVTLEEMESYRFPPADEKALEVLLGLCGR